MKFVAVLLLQALCAGAAESVIDDARTSPVVRVVALLKTLKAKIETDGKSEQQIYDKYACFSEDAMKRKTDTIAKSEADIAAAEELIIKLAAQIAAGKTNIKNLADDIAENIAAQKEADEKRQAELEAYMAEMKELVACQGALAEAIKVLKDTGTGSLIERKFLGAIQQSQVVSIASGLRKVLKSYEAVGSVSEDDLSVLRDFVARPSDFFGDARSPKASVSAMQMAQQSKLNPFGDYSPRSTRIQGILKGMYDTFTADIGNAAKEEKDAAAAYAALSATRKRELKTLQETKLIEEKDTAGAKKLKADTEVSKAETEDILADAEAFLEETKASSMKTASEWAERCRLRTEELQSIEEAVQILSAPESSKIFTNATTTFLQVASTSVLGSHSDSKADQVKKAYKQLQRLATGLHNMQLAKIAAKLKLGGHFDSVIAMIDTMMGLLRKEEAADIFHRDRCESANNANVNEISDLEGDISKNEAAMSKMEGEIKTMEDKIAAHQSQIDQTKADMAKMLEIRNADHADFVQALKDDTDAIALIENAIVSLNKYYINNKLKIGALLQRETPKYSVSEDTAPKVDFSSGDKFASESGGIVAILSMIKEDFELEVKTSREEEAAAEAAFDEMTAKMQAEVDSLEAAIASLEGEKASTDSDLADAGQLNISKTDDLKSQDDLKSTLYEDCSWVASNFDSRYQKRKTEMEGLTQAKAYLAGIGDKSVEYKEYDVTAK